MLVSGTPAPFIKWYVDGEPLYENSSKIENEQRNEGDGRHVLVLPYVADLFTVKCEAENEAGKAECEATVKRRGGGEIDLSSW